MASNFYRGNDKPRYILGHALEIGFISAGLIAAVVLILSYAAVNKQRNRRLAEGEGVLNNEELSSMGDKAYTFRYMY